jgi:hypothetical protein
VSATHELEIETRKIVRCDLHALIERFPIEWKETLEDVEDEGEAAREFLIECWLSSPRLFESTAFDDVDYYTRELNNGRATRFSQ